MKSNNPPTAADRANRLAYWFSRHWLKVVLAIIFVFLALPFAAPTLVYAGLEGPAHVIYTVYKPLCHQLGFRSMFLFGEQPYYPLAQAEVEWLRTYQDYAIQDEGFKALFASFRQMRTGEALTAGDITAEMVAPLSPELQLAAHEFVGNARMGYKVAICERDIAIYAAILLGGMLFTLVRRRLRPVPLLLYLVLGVGPIALDGGSQLLSSVMLGDPPVTLWPLRETNPFLRFLTGALFGAMNVWLAFPYIEMSMREIRQDLAAKFTQESELAARQEAARARLEGFVDAWEREEDNASQGE